MTSSDRNRRSRLDPKSRRKRTTQIPRRRPGSGKPPGESGSGSDNKTPESGGSGNAGSQGKTSGSRRPRRHLGDRPHRPRQHGAASGSRRPGRQRPQREPQLTSGHESGSKLPSRWLAFFALQAFEQRGVFLSAVLDDLYRQHQIEPRERRFATELAAETLRRQLTLDTILAAYVDRPREEVEPELWQLLRLGVLQLLFLPHIPPHAAVNETVSLCHRLRRPQARGFLNGVLRSIEREIQREPHETDPRRQILLPDHGSVHPTSEDAAQRTSRLQLSRPVFASPNQDFTTWASQQVSLPRWLIARWESQYSDRDELVRDGLWFTTQGRMYFRVNANQTTREKTLDVLRTAGLTADAAELPESIAVTGSAVVSDLPGFADGWFSVQDISAMAIADLLAPQPGERILDLCAAPGGKTCHLAERLQGTGEVVACDLSEARLKPLRENVGRLKLSNVSVHTIASDGNGMPVGPYDAVLVDVPCSNTGVLGKRPEARWRLKPESFTELIPLQQQLLVRAIEAVKPGGRVIYSTCSIDEQENEQVVRAILETRTDVTLNTERRHVAGRPSDGGYQALLRRGPTVS